MTKIDGQPVPTDQRERILASIRMLEEIRRSAAEDLACMGSHKQGSAWEQNRQADIRFATRAIKRLRDELSRIDNCN